MLYTPQESSRPRDHNALPAPGTLFYVFDKIGYKKFIEYCCTEKQRQDAVILLANEYLKELNDDYEKCQGYAEIFIRYPHPAFKARIMPIINTGFECLTHINFLTASPEQKTDALLMITRYRDHSVILQDTYSLTRVFRELCSIDRQTVTPVKFAELQYALAKIHLQDNFNHPQKSFYRAVELLLHAADHGSIPIQAKAKALLEQINDR